MSISKISLADGIEIVVDSESVKMTATEVSLASDADSIKTTLESKTVKSLSDVYFHKAQDGTLYARTNDNTSPWPDEEPEDKADKYAEDPFAVSVSSGGIPKRCIPHSHFELILPAITGEFNAAIKKGGLSEIGMDRG